MSERFIMAIVNDGEQKEVSIIDIEEDNVQLFCCTVEEEDLFFIKQEFQQILDLSNFQNNLINRLSEKIETLTRRN